MSPPIPVRDLTTGEAAKIMGVDPKEIARLVDSGHLRGYTIPGSKHRRVPRCALAAFMTKHGIPRTS